MATITITGTLGAAPRLEFTPGGKAVAQLSICDQPRTRDESGQWHDGEPTWWQIKVWGPTAEHLAESTDKGHRLTITGRTLTETWVDKQTGEQRSRIVVIADSVSLPLDRDTYQRQPRLSVELPEIQPA